MVVDVSVLNDHDVDAQARDIATFDLSMVKKKLMEPAPEGRGWSEEQAKSAETWYRRYLTLVAKYPEATHVPNDPIDAFWHQHILDTRKYAEDCHWLLGKFLHHYPYFGLNGDEAERDQAFEATNLLYIREFGEDCTSMEHLFSAKGMSCNSAGSGTGCSQKCKSG